MKNKWIKIYIYNLHIYEPMIVPHKHMYVHWHTVVYMPSAKGHGKMSVKKNLEW